ncbi:UNVERIFIED_CONTAM: hypothetical protein RMT77_005209 [Armadillidium vulgare]
MASNYNVLSQYITAICASLMSFGMGSIVGYSSPVGIFLTRNAADSSVHLTSLQNSWFASVYNIGALAGSPLAGICIEMFGRKGTILISSIPFIAGWALIVAAQNFSMIIIGRILTGVYCSLISISVPIYIGEFSSPDIRGRLGTIFNGMTLLGLLLPYSTGVIFDSFRLVAIACTIIPAFGFVFMLFMKESPIYLLSVGKEEEAKVSLKFFRGKNFPGLTKEFETLKTALKEKKESQIRFSDLSEKRYRNPFLMCLGLMSFRQLCGITAILSNMSSVFQSSSYKISSHVASLIVLFAQYFGTLIGIYMVDRQGRKLLLQISASLMAFSHLALGVFFYLKDFHASFVDNASWLPLVLVSLYLCSFSAGYGPVPWLMLGELCSPEAKKISTSIATMSNWACSFLATLAFQPLQEIVYDFGVFWIFAGICFIGFIFSTFCIFETKGKSLLEINAHFEGKQVTTHF